MKSSNTISKNKKIGLIIYGRTGSRRFPNKIITKLNNGKNLLEFILERVKKSKFKKNIIVATSKKESDKKLLDICNLYKINFFEGSENNVFLRTQKCINKFKLDYFARICADRPFFDVKLMDKMIKILLNNNFDIVTNTFTKNYPKGLACEVAKTSIFLNVKSNNLSKNNKEHIFNFFYKKKNYKIYNFKNNFNKKFIQKNFSIDSKSDLKKIKRIINDLKKNNLSFSTSSLYKLYK